MMSFTKNDLFACLLLILTSILTVFDLFVNTGRSATMDGLTHITTIAQFGSALQNGDFPVRWLDGFANYGLPLGIIVHQFPSYLGGVINMLLNDPVLSFTMVTFLGVVFSSIFYYIFLRLYSSPLVAFTGAFVFSLAPYRIINIFIRGAIPETFSAIFPPLILISLFFLIKRNDRHAFFLLIFSFFGLLITHPMMVVVYSFLLFYYFLYLLFPFNLRKVVTNTVIVGAGAVLALGMASYYLLPLLLETKYFYYGSEESHLVLYQFMNIHNFFDSSWYYFTQSEIFTRGHVIKAGLPETVIFLSGVIVAIILRIQKGLRTPPTILEYIIVTGAVVIFFMTSFSNIFYSLFPILGNIQFPWRFFSAFLFLPPFLVVLFLKRTKFQLFFIVVIIIFFSLIRFPQLYGKNYAHYENSQYYFTTQNLHSTSLNTIWTGETESYPIKKEKAEIISGNGTIVTRTVSNSSREYDIHATTPLRLVDYTFYFPGWKVWVDGQEVPIEFQDSNYRGVITYDVPVGEHTVKMDFTETKVRMMSNMISIFFIGSTVLIFLFRKKINSYFL